MNILKNSIDPVTDMKMMRLGMNNSWMNSWMEDVMNVITWTWSQGC